MQIDVTKKKWWKFLLSFVIFIIRESVKLTILVNSKLYGIQANIEIRIARLVEEKFSCFIIQIKHFIC